MDVGYRVSKNFWRMWLAILVDVLVVGGLLVYKMYNENIKILEELGNNIFSYVFGFYVLGCVLIILLVEKPILDKMKVAALEKYKNGVNYGMSSLSMTSIAFLFATWLTLCMIVLPYTILNVIVQYIVYIICRLCKKQMTDKVSKITSVAIIVGPILILFVFSFVIFVFQAFGDVMKFYLK